MFVFDDFIYNDEIGKTLMAQYTVPDIFSEDLWQLAKGHKNYPAYRRVIANSPLGVTLFVRQLNVRSLRVYGSRMAEGAGPFLSIFTDSTRPQCIVRTIARSMLCLSSSQCRRKVRSFRYTLGGRYHLVRAMSTLTSPDMLCAGGS